MCVIKSRVHFQCLAQLLNCFVILSRIEQNATNVGVDDDRERVEFQRTVHLGNGFRKSTEWRQYTFGIPLVRSRVVWIEFNGALKFAACLNKVEVIGKKRLAERGVGFGKGIV